MDSSIIVALITGLASVIAVVITNSSANKELNARLDKQQAVTESKLEELTREVRKHNNFAEKIPVIEEQIKVVNHRIEDLEKAQQKAQNY